MDFLSTFQKSLVRIVHKAFFTLHIPATPQRVVVDMRAGQKIPKRADIVALVAKYPSVLFVVQMDEATDVRDCLLLLHFIHRLDCTLWVYSFDCIVEIPSDLIDGYVVRQSKSFSDSLPSYFFSHRNVRLELVYNQEIGDTVAQIARKHAFGSLAISLVLPERARELPQTDIGWEEWRRDHFSVHPSFASDLGLLRSEPNKEAVGYRSSRVCRIDQIQLVLGADGIRSCPHKNMGTEHRDSIRSCSRNCVTPELRSPSTRKMIASLDTSSLRRQLL